MAWLSVWWVWLAAALVFGVIELMVPVFLFLGFAIGAACVGLLLLVLPLQIGASALVALFAGLSLAAWVILRLTLRGGRGARKLFDRDINDG
ncbi:hypothetical protein [Aestuariicoccus sp. MJ-SS9]|uniref:NfeD family protein n=1 Tax=Aestuariicoccus sp. MJ-SS9 TaxID=3079855 RepID=UPI00290EF903|nr:hypothetical protein [Aestuariicoccus sp. MJ-SS9]MDU8910615.1 hypothetical protein [Aestuariicoccus sp. MJ-SS9]